MLVLFSLRDRRDHHGDSAQGGVIARYSRGVTFESLRFSLLGSQTPV